MEFTYNGSLTCLKGITSTCSSLIDDREMCRISELEHKGLLLQLISEETQESMDKSCEVASELLGRFTKVFQEPAGLPPSRSRDHQISLKHGYVTVSVRPYRYPYYQKSKIEKIVKELLGSRVITPSQAPFSSPMLLVRKTDGSWRMCIDYRVLNEAIVKDKYLIPVVDELLDELFGSTIYSKLDLRSGYHRIRMKEEDQDSIQDT